MSNDPRHACAAVLLNAGEKIREVESAEIMQFYKSKRARDEEPE